MDIILNETIENLGSVGEVIKVKDGFGRNYLLPRGLAVLATQPNVARLEREKAKEIQKERELKAEAEKKAGQIRALSLTHEAKAGEDGKLFGSVTANDIQALLSKEKVEGIDKKDIRILKPIRKVGAHDVEVRCYTNVKAQFKLWVVAEKQAKASKK